MKPEARGWTEARTTFLIIAISVLYLGVRSQRAAHGVHAAPDPRHAAAEDSSLAAIRADLRRTASAESLLANHPDALADPFAPRAALSRAPIAATPAEAPVVVPTIGGLVFDADAPVVQLRVGGHRSDWLLPGSVFEGWRVLEIRPTSVRLERNGRTVELSSSTEGSE